MCKSKRLLMSEKKGIMKQLKTINVSVLAHLKMLAGSCYSILISLWFLIFNFLFSFSPKHFMLWIILDLNV